MNCPKCGRLMFNLPDPMGRNSGVFYCSCGYNSVKRPRRNNGSRTCPRCGEEVEFVQSEGRTADHYECRRCMSEIERRLRERPFLAERLERSAPREHGISFLAVTVLVVAMVVASIFVTTIDARAATSEDLEIDLRPDPRFAEVLQPQEIGNGSMPDSTLDTWIEDLGDDFPNGTYYGTLFRGSAFEVDRFRPYWRPQDQYARTGRFSYAMLSGHFNWSARTLMSGTSEWWLKLPLLASSIEVMGGVYLAIFEGCIDADQVQFDERPYTNKYLHVRPSWNGNVPDDFVIYNFPDWADHRGEPATGRTGAGDLFVRNDHVYLRVHSILRPLTDYVISVAFRLPEDEFLRPLWTGAESPAGRSTRICWADYLVTDIESNDTYAFNVTGQEIVDVDLDLDWSFIFTEGVGGAGLFGFRFQVVNGTTLYTYPFLNTSLDPADDGLMHPSFMLPWISDEEFTINLWVDNMLDEGKIGAQDFHHWQFEPDGGDPGGDTFEWIADINYTYRDFCLFSVNWTLDLDDGDYPFTDEDRYNVMVAFRFLNPGNLTLLCYDLERPEVDWGDIEPWNDNSTTWPWARPSVLDATDYGSFMLNYGVFVSAWGTEGEWAQVQQNTTTGRKIYTYHFPNRIDLSSMDWRIRGHNSEEELSPVEIAWQEVQDLWGEGHKWQAVAAAFKATALTIWDGGTRIVGYIEDGISDLWESMKNLGQWLWTSMVSLYERIVKFLEDMWDVFVDTWSVLRYLVAPMVLVVLFSTSTSLIKKMMRDRLDLNSKGGRMLAHGDVYLKREEEAS